MIGSRGIALIKSFESCRLEAYKDSRGIWTIGWGHTRGVSGGDICTREQADKWFVEDLAEAEGPVNRLVRVPLTQGMRDALVSFVYNLGEPRFRDSTLRRYLNQGRYLECPEQFMRWWHTPGSELGLLRRRAREVMLFLEDGIP